MSKRKVLDPWRTAPEPEPEPVKDVRERRARDPDADEYRYCVQFKGKKCGVNVWLDYQPTPQDNPNDDALEQLCLALAGLFDVDCAPTLNRYGIYRDEVPEDVETMCLDWHGRTYIRLADGPWHSQVRAVTTLCHAFRALQVNDPRGAKVLADHRIKPYVT